MPRAFEVEGEAGAIPVGPRAVPEEGQTLLAELLDAFTKVLFPRLGVHRTWEEEFGDLEEFEKARAQTHRRN